MDNKYSTTIKKPATAEEVEELKRKLRQSFGLSEPEPTVKPVAADGAGMSDLEKLAAGLPVEGAKEGVRRPRTWFPSVDKKGWLPYLTAQGVRIGGGLLSAPGLLEGAAVSGTAETLAQKIESADPIDAGAVGIESAIGAVPFGKIIKAVKPAIGIGKQLALNAGRMAGYVEGGNLLRRMYHDSGTNPDGSIHIGNPLPTTPGQLAMDVGTTLVGAKLANLHPRFNTFAGTKGKTVKSVTSDLANAIEGNVANPATGSTGQAALDDLIRQHSGGIVSEPTLVKSKKGGAVPLSESKLGADMAPVVTTPIEKTLGGLRVASPDAGALGKRGRVVELPQNPIDYAQTINASSVENAALPRIVQMELATIDARPSNIPREWLDSVGNPITPEATKMLAHEAATKDLAKAKVMEKFHASQDTTMARRTKAEQVADQENLRNRQGGTDISKVKIAEEKAAQVANKERVDVEKTHATANKMVEDETRQANAQNAIDRVIQSDEFEASSPTVSETTVKVPTTSGSQTMKQTYRQKPPPPDTSGEINIDDIPAAPPSAPVNKPHIPKTNPNVVSKTVYPTQMAALNDLAGAGQRGNVERIGRGKWRVVFEKAEEPVAPKVEAPVAEAIEPAKEVAIPEAAEPVKSVESTVPVADRAAIEADVNPAPVAPVPETPAGTGSRSSGNSSVDARLRKRARKEAQAAPVAPKRSRKDVEPVVAKESPVEAAKPLPEPSAPKAEAPVAAKPAIKPEAPKASIAKGKNFTSDGNYDIILSNGKKTKIFYDKGSQIWYEDKPTTKQHTSHYSDNWGFSKEELIAKLEAGSKTSKSVTPKTPATKAVASKPTGFAAELRTWSTADLTERSKSLTEVKDRVTKAHVDAELVRRGKPVPVAAAPKVEAKPEIKPETKSFEGPDRVVETPKPAKAAEEAKPANDNIKRDSFETMAENARSAPNATKVDLTGAVDGPEVRRRVINELENYKKQVDAAEAAKGVDEKGQYAYPVPIPKPLVLEVPGGPTFTIKPDQVTGAIERLEKGLSSKGYEYRGTAAKIDADDAFKGIVDKASRPTEVKIPAGHGTNFNAESGKAPAIKLPVGVPKKAAAPIAAKPIEGTAPKKIQTNFKGFMKKVFEEPATKVEAPKADINDLAIAEKAAADKYWELKNGKAPNEEIRAAGKAYGEAKYALAQASKEAEASGKSIPFAKEPPKAPKPKGKGPTNEDIASMPPDKQEAAIQKVVDEFKNPIRRGKGKQGEKGTVIGSGLGGFQELLEKHPQFALKLGTTAAGAMIGARTTPDDPLSGAILGAAAGFYGPAAYRAIYTRARSLPAGSKARAQVDKALGQQVKDLVTGAFHVMPDYFRASYLSNIPSLMMNSWVGPHGAAIMGALEAGLAGDPRGLKALKVLMGPKFYKNWAGPAMKEADTLVTKATERGDVTSDLGRGLQRTIVTAPARAMTAGDIAARQILMSAGFSELEARSITLTSEPASPLATAIGAFRRAKGGKGTVSWAAKMMLPFYKTGVNQLEQSALRMPWGNSLRKAWNMTPVSTKQLAVQTGITGTVALGSFALGRNLDKVNEALPKSLQVASVPLVLKFLTNFAGPYGATVGAAFLAGVASQKTDDIAEYVPKGILRYLKNGAPLPSGDVFAEWLKFAADMAHGKFNPPYGTVPAPLSSKQLVSIPTLGRVIAGDSEAERPTKNELSLLAPFVKNPQLAPKPKTAYQRRMQIVRDEAARKRREYKERLK